MKYSRPVIGITSDLVTQSYIGIPKGRARFVRIHLPYAEAITRAQGIPFVIPPSHDKQVIKYIIPRLQGLLIHGGNDLAPALYGEKPLPQIKPIDPVRQGFDLQLIRLAWQKKLPILAICYGVQLINVARGGTLFQNLATQLKGTLPHRRRPHRVYINPLSRLGKLLKAKTLKVNSFHHQTVKHLGKGLTINALSEDGLIEGIESIDPRHFLLGVQWHPERMLDDTVQCRLFQALVRASR